MRPESSKIKDKIRKAKNLADPFHSDLDAIINYFKPDPLLGTIIKPTHIGGNGTMTHTYKSKTYYVARLVWMAEKHVLLPKSYEVRHKSYNLLDDRFENLILLIHSERYPFKKINPLTGERVSFIKIKQ